MKKFQVQGIWIVLYFYDIAITDDQNFAKINPYSLLLTVTQDKYFILALILKESIQQKDMKYF